MTELAVGQTVVLATGQRAVIRFVGETAFSSGEWVGVELEEPTGKNDGSVKGDRYFECDMNYGMFVRPQTMTVIQAAPPPAPAAAKPATAKKPSRPSSLTATARRPSASESGLNRRRSLNAPSPSPVTRNPRPLSAARSPTKSPTKQLSTAAPSASNSRTATPSNTRPGLSGGAKPRPSVGGGRPSMGPPPLPGARSARQVSSTLAPTRTAVAPARSASARLSSAGRPGTLRTEGARNMSGGSGSGNDNSSIPKSGARSGIDSPRKSDDEIPSPQPNSPVQAKTRALERLTTGSSPVTTPRSGAAGASSRTPSNAAATKEIEDLKAKIRVLEKKRIEDRDKLRSLESSKTSTGRDKEQFEMILKKLQTKGQTVEQENQELKRQLQEAEIRLEQIEAIQAEHETMVELATLDREMAEETAEVYKAELDALKQKAEELELEVEILREENGEFTNGMSTEERASTGWLQMERNNERLREALIRLRDLTQQTEEEFRDQIKSLEDDLQEFDALKEKYTVSQEALAKSAEAVQYLQEQVDASAADEVLVSELRERIMSQSEQIEELKNTIDELETSLELSEELEINHVHNERELLQEIEFKDSVIAEQARRAAQQEQAQEEMESTLFKFRELVTNLQSDLEDMRASQAVTEVESEQLHSRSRAMLDLNMKLQISAAKAQVKTVDLELRRLEAEEAAQHLEIVQLFLPESCKSDRDSVMALLRFKRLTFKANLLSNAIKERINGQPHPGHEDDIFWGCEAIDKFTWVSTMCDRFVSSMSHCSLEAFAKYQGSLYELEPVERALNGWIDGLRRDDLKEQQCASELQRTIALMTHLAEVHIPSDLESFADDVHTRVLLAQSYLESSATTFATTKAMVQNLVPAAGDEDELAQYFLKKVEGVITQTRATKVTVSKVARELEELKARSLCLTPETMEAFEECETGAQQIAELARKTGLDLHKLLHEEGRSEAYTYSEVQACVHQTALTAFSSSEGDLFSTYLSKLRVVSSQIADLAALSTDLDQTQEFERSLAPWVLRSQELKNLRSVPADAEEELRRLRENVDAARRAVAMREESLSEANLKIETLEARMRDAKAKAALIVELEHKIADAEAQVAKRNEDIEKQDRELKTLEADRDKWKKIASDSRIVPGGGEAGVAGAKAGQERAVATAREMDALKYEIESLQSAVRYLREDNRCARTTELHRHDWLAEPLVRKQPSPTEQRKSLVAAEAKDALGELVRMAGSARLYRLDSLPEDKLSWRPARKTPQYHAAKQMEDFALWRSWQDAVLQKSRLIESTTAQMSSHSTAQADAAKAKIMRRAAAKLQIRLPGEDGKAMSGMGRHVQIVGSREWESLQGRVAVV